MKGKTIIELTDIHTGRKETHIDHNMITNALTEIFKPLGLLKDPSKFMNSFAPFYQNLLGGLLLFDNQIEEDATKLFAPQTANLVGCASYGVQNNTTGTLRGGFNQTESELNTTDRYMKYVYDFTTSQANGTIASVCLTHKNGGYTGYGGKDAVTDNSIPLGVQIDSGVMQYAYPSYTGAETSDKYTGYTLERTELLFLIDRAADLAYYFRIDSATQITVIKRRAWLKSVSVLDNPYNKKTFVEEERIEFQTALLSTNYLSYYFDIADNCLYLISASNSYTAPNASMQVTRITLNNWSVSQYEMVNTSEVTLSTYGTRFALVHQGYMFVKANDNPYNMYKFEVGNAANVTQITKTGVSHIYGTFCLAINGRIYLEYYTSGTYYLYVVNMENDEIMLCEASHIFCGSRYPCYTPVKNEPLIWFESYGNYTTGCFIMITNYLATINNLSEPVTKTADKTMKVTYLIQEE